MDIPHIYRDDPDPLSTLLSRLELRAEVYVSGEFCGTWAVDTAGSKRIPFHLIGEGTAWLHFGDDEGRLLEAHDLVVFPHDAHHIISNSEVAPPGEQVNEPMSNDGDVTHMVCGFFEFRSPVLFPVLESLPAAVVLRAADEGVGPRMVQLIELMLRELSQARPGHYAAVDQMAALLFIEVMRQQVEAGTVSSGILAALFDPRIGRALNAIHRQPEIAWTLLTLAETAAMSRSSFAERFNKLVGVAPMKYLTGWRMNEARRLLATTSMSTAQVAEKSGYESEAAFRKAFRNTLGITPGSVRTPSI